MNVSVIIPCFNVEDYISECLDSVKLQGNVVSEIFCVDNNSTDDTVSKIKSWKRSNPEIVVNLLSEKKPGACAARNAPLHLVKTEWIQFLDADDLLLESKITEQLKVVVSAGNLIDEVSDVLYDSFIKRDVIGNEILVTPDADILLGLMKGNVGNTCANLWRTTIIVENGGWDESLSSSQEYNLLMRLYSAGASFKMLNTFKTVIRSRASGQISQGNQVSIWQNYTELRIRFFNDEIVKTGDLKLISECEYIIFGAIRILFKFDSIKAIELFNSTLKQRDFKPRTNTIFSRLYLILFTLLGFKLAENFRLCIRKLWVR